MDHKQALRNHLAKKDIGGFEITMYDWFPASVKIFQTSGNSQSYTDSSPPVKLCIILCLEKEKYCYIEWAVICKHKYMSAENITCSPVFYLLKDEPPSFL